MSTALLNYPAVAIMKGTLRLPPPPDQLLAMCPLGQWGKRQRYQWEMPDYLQGWSSDLV